MPKPVVFNLDDFYEVIMNEGLWDNILALKHVYPKFKVTMFTCPLLCSEHWLQMIKAQYPWIEMHYHGTRHADPNEWYNRETINLPYGQYFFKGFKAPWYRMDQKTADLLMRQGYLISTGNGDICGRNVYRFNIGIERIPDVWYENDHYHCFNSHVQHQDTLDGLPDILSKAVQAFDPDSDFLFISEVDLQKMTYTPKKTFL
jgi:hypothetical protein